MKANELPVSAKIYQFPIRRLGQSGGDRTARRHDHVAAEPARAIHWDAWYHQEAIVEDRAPKA